MFWERFYNLCLEKDTKPNPVAKKIGISSGIVTKWKNEDTLPNGETLLKIADYFNVSVDYLLGRTNDYTKVTGSTTIQSPQPSELNEDEQDILQIYRSLSRRTKHEFMSMAYKMQNHDGLED